MNSNCGRTCCRFPTLCCRTPLPLPVAAQLQDTGLQQGGAVLLTIAGLIDEALKGIQLVCGGFGIALVNQQLGCQQVPFGTLTGGQRGWGDVLQSPAGIVKLTGVQLIADGAQAVSFCLIRAQRRCWLHRCAAAAAQSCGGCRHDGQRQQTFFQCDISR